MGDTEARALEQLACLGDWGLLLAQMGTPGKRAEVDGGNGTWVVVAGAE